jgi:hypothetical protein
MKKKHMYQAAQVQQIRVKVQRRAVFGRMAERSPYPAKIVQRETVINWDESPYKPNEVIRSTRYVRSRSAGGNHFVPDKWIADTIINIIRDLKRKDAFGILQKMRRRWGDCARHGLL